MVVAALAVVAPLLPAYPLTLLTQALIVAILAMSLDVLLGYTGLSSLGHAAYFGVGAYAVAIMTTEKQAGPVSACLAVGVLLAAVTAAIFGLLAIRATGTYFLMITLALGMVTGGSPTAGSRSPRATTASRASRGLDRVGLDLSAPVPFYYFCLVVRGGGVGADGAAGGVAVRPRRCAASVAARRACRRWATTCGCTSTRPSSSRACSRGFAGTLWAYYNGFVSPNDVQLVTSVETLLMVALGGPGTLIGPALGAGIIVFLKNFVSVYTKRWLLSWAASTSA